MEKAEKLKVLTSAKIGESFSDEAASAAASRLRGRLQQTTLYAGVPADALVDLTIVATNKVKNGVVNFTEFSKQMVAEFSEKVKPELEKLYQGAMEKVFGYRRNLDSQEVLGGHTIERHIGKSESWLRRRLGSDSDLRYASSFKNEAIANRVQGRFVNRYKSEVEEWFKKNSNPFKKDFDMLEPVGNIVERGKTGETITTKVRLIVVKDANSPQGWRIHTSFPIIKEGVK